MRAELGDIIYIKTIGVISLLRARLHSTRGINACQLQNNKQQYILAYT